MKIQNILFAPFKLADYTLDRIVALAGAVLFVQFPQFIVHYIQRLGGHVDELRRIVEQYHSIALGSGKNLDDYVRLAIASKVEDLSKLGTMMRENIDRYNELSSLYEDLVSSGVFKKLFIFIKGLNWDIAKAAWKEFVPALPLNGEGLLYALLGLVLGMVLYAGIKKSLQALFGRIFGKINKG